MHTDDLYEYFDGLDDLDQGVRYDKRAQRREEIMRTSRKLTPDATKKFVKAQDDSRSTFHYTYKAARFEEGWLLDSLGGLYEHQWISDVLRKVRGGKEASVYLCRSGTAIGKEILVAAKVYRPRMLRSLKNDHLYREGRADLDDEGRVMIDDGSLHAMAKRTAFGEELRHQSWIAYEFTTMQTLFEAGADIPQPYEMANNAILTSYVGDEDGPAPALSEVSLDEAEAKSLYERTVHNLHILLQNERVHGDLSAYNILYWEGGIQLIDFPQVVSPKSNRNAYSIFARDVARVCEYFDRQGVQTDARRLAQDLWTSHGYRIKEEVHPRLLDAENPKDRRLWEQQKKKY